MVSGEWRVGNETIRHSPFAIRLLTTRHSPLGANKTGAARAPVRVGNAPIYLMLLFSVRSKESLPITVASHHFDVPVPLVTPRGSPPTMKHCVGERSVS